MAESSPKEEKALWEKEKLLVTSNFSFSHRVLRIPVLHTLNYKGLFGKGSRSDDMYQQAGLYLVIKLTPIYSSKHLLANTRNAVFAVVCN